MKKICFNQVNLVSGGGHVNVNFTLNSTSDQGHVGFSGNINLNDPVPTHDTFSQQQIDDCFAQGFACSQEDKDRALAEGNACHDVLYQTCAWDTF